MPDNTIKDLNNYGYHNMCALFYFFNYLNARNKGISSIENDNGNCPNKEISEIRELNLTVWPLKIRRLGCSRKCDLIFSVEIFFLFFTNSY